MLGRDWNEAPDKEDRSQESGVRSQEVEASDEEQGMRVSVSAESVGVRGSGRASITQHHYMLRAEDFT